MPERRQRWWAVVAAGTVAGGEAPAMMEKLLACAGAVAHWY